MFPSSGERRETLTLLGTLERSLDHSQAISKGPNRVRDFLLSPEDGNRTSFRNVVFIVFRISDDGQSPETAILSVTDHRPNPSDSACTKYVEGSPSSLGTLSSLM
jgi:hypothetical protein